MSKYFENVDNKDESKSKLIAPDYSEAIKEAKEREEDEDSISDIDEAEEDEIVNKKENKNMAVTTPFGTTPTTNSQTTTQTSTPAWGNNSNSYNPPAWGSSNQSSGSSSFWGQSQQNKPAWGSSGTSSWGSSSTVQNTNGKVEIDRTKKYIITDFLDIIAETYQSNGNPGLIPRDIYDLKPRLDVWSKLQAFSPEKIYILSQVNLVRGTAGISEAWNYTFGYYCISLSSFLRLPFRSCQVIAQTTIGLSKANIINSIINSDPYNPLNPKDVVCIGINSGLYGQSNVDKVAAETCGIDYIDLTQLLNNMY